MIYMIRQIICTMTAAEVAGVTAAYEKLFGVSLPSAVGSDTSGDYKTLLVSLLTVIFKKCLQMRPNFVNFQYPCTPLYRFHDGLKSTQLWLRRRPRIFTMLARVGLGRTKRLSFESSPKILTSNSPSSSKSTRRFPGKSSFRLWRRKWAEGCGRESKFLVCDCWSQTGWDDFI